MTEKKKRSIAINGSLIYKVVLFLFFVWFIMACLVLPNLNTVISVFWQEG